MPFSWARVQTPKNKQNHWRRPQDAPPKEDDRLPFGASPPNGQAPPEKQAVVQQVQAPPGPQRPVRDVVDGEQADNLDYGILLLDQESLQKAILKIGDELKSVKTELVEIRRQNEILIKNIKYQDFINMAVGMASAKRRNTPESRAELAQLMARLPGAEPTGGGPSPSHEAQPESEPTAPEKAASSPEKKRSVGAKIANGMFYLCMVLLIVGAVLFAKSTDPQKSLFGFRYYYIKSASMAPVYPVGSVVITKSTLPEEIQVGDDITIYVSEDGGDTYLTHRVVEITTDSAGELAFRTRGVNNKSNDPTPFNAKLVVGRVVFCIPLLGTVMTFVNTQLPFVIGIFVLLIALAFMLRLLFTKEEDTGPADSPKPKNQKRAKREKAVSKERVVWKATEKEPCETRAP